MSQPRSKELKNARQEMAAAEGKIADGIKKLHELASQKLKDTEDSKEFQSSVNSYDSQGVAKVELTSAEIKEAKLGSYFPEGLDKGISILFFKGPLTHPPIQYMVQQKIRLLCRTAENDFAVKNIDKIQTELFAKLAKEIENLKSSDEDYHEKSKQLMDKYIGKTCTALYQNLDKKSDIPKIFHELYPQKDLDKISIEKQFVKSLNKKSTHYRSSEMAILTFNETTNKFSFDVPPKTERMITAHARGIGNGTANLSTVWEGTIRGDNYQVTSQLVKHGSPAPLDAIKAKKDPVEILIDTYQNLKEVTGTIAKNRLHGRGNLDKSINVDLTYHLLTSNILNQEKQRPSYQFTASAAQLMSGVTFEQNGMKITPQVHVINFGINILTGNNPISETDRTLGFENRITYIHLSDALQTAVPLTECSDNLKSALGKDEWKGFSEKIEPLTQLTNQAADQLVKAEIDESKVILNKIEENNISFKIACDYYLSEKDKLRAAESKLINENDPDQRAALINLIQHKKELLIDAKNDIQQCIDSNQAFREELGKIQTIIHTARKKFFLKANIQNNIQFISEDKNGILKKLSHLINNPQTDPVTKKEAEEYATSLIAHVCKAYMDQLYYSKQIRYPDKAALFHSYSIMYEHLLGLSSNTGCKSANDRTYIVRLFVAHLNGQPLAQVSIPPNVTNSDEFQKMIHALDQDAMTNSAMISTTHDSGGGTPKAGTGVINIPKKASLKEKWKWTKQKITANFNTSIFKWLKGIKGLQESFRFGSYAPHKLAKNSKLIKEVSKNLLLPQEIKLQTVLKKFRDVHNGWENKKASLLAIAWEKKRKPTEEDIEDEKEKLELKKIEETTESVKEVNDAMVAYLKVENINTNELPYYIDQNSLIHSFSFQLDEAIKEDKENIPEDLFKNKGFLARLFFGEGSLDYNEKEQIYANNGKDFLTTLLKYAFPIDESTVPLITMKLLIHTYSYLSSVDPNIHPEVLDIKKMIDDKLKDNWDALKKDWDTVITKKYPSNNSISGKIENHLMNNLIKKPNYLRNTMISRLALAGNIPDWLGKNDLVKFFIIHPEHFAASMDTMSEDNINIIQAKIGNFKDIETLLYHQLREWSIMGKESVDPNDIFNLVNKKISDWNKLIEDKMKLPKNQNDETLTKLKSLIITSSNPYKGIAIEIANYFIQKAEVMANDPIDNQRIIYLKVRELIIAAHPGKEITPALIIQISNNTIELWNEKNPNNTIPLLTNERGKAFEIEKTFSNEIISGGISEKIYEKMRHWELLNDPMSTIESSAIAAQSNHIIDELKTTLTIGDIKPIDHEQTLALEDKILMEHWDKMTNNWDNKMAETSLTSGKNHFEKESSEIKSDYPANLFQILNNFNHPLPNWISKYDLVMLLILHPEHLVDAFKNGDPTNISKLRDLNKLPTLLYEQMREWALSSNPDAKINPHDLTKSVNEVIDKWNTKINQTYGEGDANKCKIAKLDIKTSIQIEFEYYMVKEKNLELTQNDIYLKIREFLFLNSDVKTTPEERLQLANNCIKSRNDNNIVQLQLLTLDDVVKIESNIELEQTSQIKALTSKIEAIDKKLEPFNIKKPLKEKSEPIMDSEPYQEIIKEPHSPAVKQSSIVEWFLKLFGPKDSPTKASPLPPSVSAAEPPTPIAAPPVTKLNSLSTTKIMSMAGIPDKATPIPQVDPEVSLALDNWVARTQQTLNEIKTSLTEFAELDQLHADMQDTVKDKVTSTTIKQVEIMKKRLDELEKAVKQYMQLLPSELSGDSKLVNLAKEIESTKNAIESYQTKHLPEEEKPSHSNDDKEKPQSISLNR